MLAELLNDYDRELGIELVPFNGEDHYSAAGEVAYLKANQGKWNQVLLNINMDALGSHQGKTLYSFYECPDEMKGMVEKACAAQAGFAEGRPWFQGDHMVFTMNGVPALALTSENFVEILTELAHTPKDSLDKVNSQKLVETSAALHNLILKLVQYQHKNYRICSRENSS